MCQFSTLLHFDRLDSSSEISLSQTLTLADVAVEKLEGVERTFEFAERSNGNAFG
jgi:hypothetical protein